MIMLQFAPGRQLSQFIKLQWSVHQPGSGSRARASRFARIISTRRFSISITRDRARPGGMRGASDIIMAFATNTNRGSLQFAIISPSRDNKSIHSFIERSIGIFFVPSPRERLSKYFIIQFYSCSHRYCTILQCDINDINFFFSDDKLHSDRMSFWATSIFWNIGVIELTRIQ